MIKWFKRRPKTSDEELVDEIRVLTARLRELGYQAYIRDIRVYLSNRDDWIDPRNLTFKEATRVTTEEL